MRRIVTQLFAALGLVLVAGGPRVEAVMITHTQKTLNSEPIAVNQAAGTRTYDIKIINGTTKAWTDYQFTFATAAPKTVTITGYSFVGGPFNNVTIVNSGAMATVDFAGKPDILKPTQSFEVNIFVKATGKFNISGIPTGISAAVPEPSTMALAGTGVLALAGMGWRRRVRPHG